MDGLGFCECLISPDDNDDDNEDDNDYDNDNANDYDDDNDDDDDDDDDLAPSRAGLDSLECPTSPASKIVKGRPWESHARSSQFIPENCLTSISY